MRTLGPCHCTPPLTLRSRFGVRGHVASACSCEDRVLDGPASGVKGSKGTNSLNCIRGEGLKGPHRVSPAGEARASAEYAPALGSECL